MNSQAKVAIPYFHSIQPTMDKNWFRCYLTQKLEVFEQFLIYLKKNRWQTIFLDEMYELRGSSIKVKDRYCVLTFDDGYVDNYIYVYPLLKKYGMKGTIFVSPECIDNKRGNKAKTLFDYWEGSSPFDSLQKTAYLNWEELIEMQRSGIIDIQSHTMTHTKYFCSDKIVDFHYPTRDSIYMITNIYPETRAHYFNHQGFNELIPYGTPCFVEKSAVITKRHETNPEFSKEVINRIGSIIEQRGYDFNILHDKVLPIWKEYKKKDAIFRFVERDKDFKRRREYEITEAKRVLENKLKKPIRFLCWPHGENDEGVHQLAINSGYLATTVGKSGADRDRLDRFERLGISFKSNLFYSKVLWQLKMKSAIKSKPELYISNLYKRLKYNKNHYE